MTDRPPHWMRDSDIGWAASMLRTGHRVRRIAWGLGAYLECEEPPTSNTMPNVWRYPGGRGLRAYWIPGKFDFWATDWELVDD